MPGELVPESPDVPFFRGLIAWRGERDAEQAIVAFDQFLAAAPDDPRVPMIRALRAEAAAADARRSGRGPRHLDPERRADAFLALESNRSAMGLRDMAHDRKPQPSARPARIARSILAVAPGSGSVHLVEALEDPLSVGERDAHAVIGHPEANAALGRVPSEPDLAASMAVLHRVVGEVQEGLRQPGRIGDARIRGFSAGWRWGPRAPR